MTWSKNLVVKSSISTHTLTWSVTEVWEKIRAEKEISTHTLTWSVTEGVKWFGWQCTNFNSHAHVERD